MFNLLIYESCFVFAYRIIFLVDKNVSYMYVDSYENFVVRQDSNIRGDTSPGEPGLG